MVWSRVVTAAAGLMLAVSAWAQPLAFSGRFVPIKAGVLVVDSQRVGPGPGVPANFAPFVWANLDLDPSVKPAGWRFDNPRASTVVTQSIRDRWAIIDSAGTPAVGTRLTKRMAPYWEVNLLTSSDRALADYDVLFLAAADDVSFTPFEREKLRRFVDAGGVLWIDAYDTAFIDALNPGPLPFFLNGAQNGPVVGLLAHPLLSTPNQLSPTELNAIQGRNAPVLGTFDGTTGEASQGWVYADGLRLRTIAAVNNQPVIFAGTIGDGHVVMTARGISNWLNRGINRQTNPPQIVANRGFFGFEPTSDPFFASAAKFAVNVVNLPSPYTHQGSGSRQTSRVPVDVEAPLVREFNVPVAGGLSAGKPPAIFKNRVVLATDDQIIVFDARNKRDLDNDGNPDDGLPDPLDSPIDIIWRSARLQGPISAPTVVETPESSVKNQILVTDSRGAVNVFDLATVGGDNVAAIARIDPPAGTPVFSLGTPPSPTVHEGHAFVVDGEQQVGQVLGRVWVIRLATLRRLESGGRNWTISQTPRMREPSASATVGYIPILDNSGGVDKVVYVPTLPGGNNRPSGFTSIWFGVRGEKPVNVSDIGGGVIQIQTRATLQALPVFISTGIDPLGVKLSVIDENGVLVPGNELTGWFDQVTESSPGVLNVRLGTRGQNRDWDRIQLRIDYTIDWSRAGNGANQTPADAFVRGNLELPDDSNAGRRVFGNVALGPNGNLFVVTAPTDTNVTGGTLFCLREEGRGDFKLLYRWDLYDGLRVRLNNVGGGNNEVRLPPAIVDEDYLVKNLIRFLDRPMTNLRFQGGVAVSGDTAYVMAVGNKGVLGGSSPTTTILAFNADPQPVEFELTNVPAGFAILQPDPARSTDKGNPEVFSVVQAGQLTYEQDGARGRVRLNNSMTVTRGRVRDAISTSLPVIIRRGGNPDIVVEPELSAGSDTFVPGFARGRWSPLRWYWVLNGFNPGGAPLLTGSTLYVGGSSFLPSLISGQFPPQPRGFAQAIDAQISPSDPFLRTNSLRPWQSQVNGLLDSNQPPGFRANPAARWPQVPGIESFDDFRVRLLQNALDEPQALGIVGGDGLVIAWGAQRIYGFRRADFLVADSGRVGRFDSSGNALWTTDQTLRSGTAVPVGSTSTGRALSRPTRIYSNGDATFWVVDSGNSRIVRLDAAGQEIRSIEGFKLDPGYDVRRAPQPLEAPDNLRTTLNQPRDVLVYDEIVPQAQNPFTNPQPLEYWVRYLIADTGNFRIVEMVDRYAYDANTGIVSGPVEYVDRTSSKPGQVETALGVLSWHSPANLSGRQYAYNSIDRLIVPDTPNNRVILAFGFGNVEPGRATFGLDSTAGQDLDRASGAGGVVLLDLTTNQSEVITETTTPAIPVNIFWNEDLQRFESTARPETTRKIQGLTSVTLRYLTINNTPTLAVMYTDRYGVSEVVRNSVQNRYESRWFLPDEVYRVIRRRGRDEIPTGSNPLGFRAQYARRLESGDVLVVNSFVGRTRNNSGFSGEVLILDGAFGGSGRQPGFAWNRINFGFNSLSVKFELPPVLGGRPIVGPVFADRR